VTVSEDGTPQLVKEMVDADVLTDPAESYRFTQEFTGRCETFEAEIESLSRSQLRDELARFTSSSAETDALLDVSDRAPSTLAEFLALSEIAEEGALTQTDVLTMVSALDSFGEETPPSDGSPEAFLPVSGERIPLLVTIYGKAIVYVWLDDCDPCETVRADLDEIFDDVPDDMALFSVYGPDHASLLAEEYDVNGGPAVLFFRDREIDARLYGAQYQDVLDTEIRKHRDL